MAMARQYCTNSVDHFNSVFFNNQSSSHFHSATFFATAFIFLLSFLDTLQIVQIFNKGFLIVLNKTFPWMELKIVI